MSRLTVGVAPAAVLIALVGNRPHRGMKRTGCRVMKEYHCA